MKKLLKLFLLITVTGLFFSCSKSDQSGFDSTGLAGVNSKGYALVQEGMFLVEPNGTNDTENLKQAFADAIEFGSGAVVRLVEGEYYIDLTEIRDFSGLFTGAGPGKTVISPISDLSIDEVYTRNLYPVLLKFVGGSVIMSEMTFSTPPGAVSTGTQNWITGLVGFFGFSQYYDPADRYINVIVDKIEIIGHTENVAYGLMTGSDSRGMNGSIPLSNIDISITNSYFSNCNGYGALIMMIKEGTIIAGTNNNGNTFINNPGVGLGIWHNTSVNIEVRSNTFICQAAFCGLELYSAPYPGVLEQVPQTYPTLSRIEQNVFDIIGSRSAIVINDNRRRFFPEESPMHLLIKNNQFNTNETSISAIRSLNLSGAVISNNKFTGSGSNGIFQARQFNVYNENGLMLGNNFSNASYSEGTLIFNIGVRNWTVVGGNLGETVVDYGENNIITGFNNNTSNVPLGSIISNNLEEIRETVHLWKEY